MASKTLNVSQEAYDALSALKRPRESFTQVILRIAGTRSLSEVAGALSDAQADAVERVVREGRDRSTLRRGSQDG